MGPFPSSYVCRREAMAWGSPPNGRLYWRLATPSDLISALSRLKSNTTGRAGEGVTPPDWLGEGVGSLKISRYAQFLAPGSRTSSCANPARIHLAGWRTMLLTLTG